MSTICIDPGHGGSDPGTGSVAGAREATVALEYALAVRDALRLAGISVEMTRTTDTTVSIAERARLANVAGARLFVSFHCNASDSPTAWGFQPIHAKGSTKGKAAAAAILAAVRSRGVPDGPRTRVVTDQSDDTGYTSAAQAYAATLDKSLSYAARDKLVREKFGAQTYRTLGVLRQTKMPAVLLELGFLTNAAERARLLSEEGRYDLVWGIRDGILDALHAIEGRPVEPSYTPPPPVPAPVLPEVTPHLVGAPAPALHLTPITVPTAAHIEESAHRLGVDMGTVRAAGAVVIDVLLRMAEDRATKALAAALDELRRRAA